MSVIRLSIMTSFVVPLPFPEATILVTAVGDPDSRAHGANESLHRGDFAASCLAEILMLDAFAQPDSEG
jgi:hypothetical protein